MRKPFTRFPIPAVMLLLLSSPSLDALADKLSEQRFYQVQRMYGFAPSVVILDHDGKALHSRAFKRQKTSEPPVRPSRHLTYEEQRVYYPLMDEWYAHEKTKLGYIPAYDFDELISRPEFFSLERLICVEFSEP